MRAIDGKMEQLYPQRQMEVRTVGLSRKQMKEIRKVRASTQDLWKQQKKVLHAASKVAHGVTSQASHAAHKKLGSHMQGHYKNHVLPVVAAAGKLAHVAEDIVE